MPTIREHITYGDWDIVRDAILNISSIGRSQNDDSDSDVFFSSNYDDHGMNTFHRVCAQPDAPIDVIDSIVDRDITNLFRPTRSPCIPLGEENSYTPLHIACESGSASTVKRLLELMERERLRRCSSRSLWAVDDTTATTLQEFIPEVCGSFNLLTCVWGSYFAPDVAYATRVEMLNNASEHFDERSFLKEICCNIRGLQSLCPDSLTKNDAFCEVWKKTMLLLRVANFGSPTKQFESEVHMIARSGRELVGTWSCPTIVMYAALKLFPNQAFEKDQWGNLPLHIACASPYHDVLGYATWKGKTMQSPYKNILYETRMTATKMLLDVHPQAASVPDGRGCLPLNLAIESAKYPYTIEELIHAAPEALDCRDLESGLDRFMFAASQGASVDVIYTLLRSSPTRVEGGIPATLCKKASDATMSYELEVGVFGEEDHQIDVVEFGESNPVKKTDENRKKRTRSGASKEGERKKRTNIDRALQRWKLRSFYLKPRSRRYQCIGGGREKATSQRHKSVRRLSV